jgi:CheY-like chemotaxis protein
MIPVDQHIMKICIIDDDPICHLIAQKMIEKMEVGAQISNFANGLDAIEYITQQKLKPWRLPEVIFLDINMPVANAWNFLEMLEKADIKGYQPWIYICSSSQDRNDVAKAQTFPKVQGYLAKPLSPSVLGNIFQDFAQQRLRYPNKKTYPFCLL